MISYNNTHTRLHTIEKIDTKYCTAIVWGDEYEKKKMLSILIINA